MTIIGRLSDELRAGYILFVFSLALVAFSTPAPFSLLRVLPYAYALLGLELGLVNYEDQSQHSRSI